MSAVDEPGPGMEETFAKHLRGATNVAVLSGAGISRESEIPTFRDPDGLWSRFDPDEVATPEAFRLDPVKVWNFHEELREVLANASPNDAHRTLADMQCHFDRFTIITQNIDGLHQEAGSNEVIELHGNAWRFRCTADDRTWIERRIPLSAIPPSCKCGAMARPDVVWFGEALPHDALSGAAEAVGNCQLLLVIGTSVHVQPAASLPFLAAEAGAAVLEFNTVQTPLTGLADASFVGKAGEILPPLWSRFKESEGI